MSSSSVVIALAGGVGAAIGAGVGQFVQWWRESVRTAIENVRRDEDRREAADRETRERRADAYREIAGVLQHLRDTMDTMAGPILSSSVMEQSEWGAAPEFATWHQMYNSIVDAIRAISGSAALYGTPSGACR